MRSITLWFLGVLFFSLLQAPPASAGRTLRPPPFYWHDWQEIINWNYPKEYIKRLEIILTNLSTTKSQTVTITVTGINGEFHTSPASAVPIEIGLDGHYPAGGAVTVGSGILDTTTAGRSKTFKFATVYRGPGLARTGDTHMNGALDVEIAVTEDVGAISGSWMLTYDNSGVDTNPTSNGYLSATILKSATQHGTFNGGRPF